MDDGNIMMNTVSCEKKNNLKNLEIKISMIKKQTAEKEQENWDFRSMLKASDISEEEIDSTAHEIYNNIKEQINCTSCGYCCKIITPVVSENDIKRIAKFLNVSITNAKRKWFKKDKNLGIILNSRPCPFLKAKKCSIYPARPLDCRSYPHLHKNRIIKYFTSIFSHIDLCPIVYHFYEGMKKSFTKKLDPKKTTWL